MKALRPSSRVRSSRRISSTCCESTGRPGREGQSILATAATQTPRNSRTTGGGPPAAGVGAITPGEGAQPANHAAARADTILDEVMTLVIYDSKHNPGMAAVQSAIRNSEVDQ